MICDIGLSPGCGLSFLLCSGHIGTTRVLFHFRFCVVMFCYVLNVLHVMHYLNVCMPIILSC